MAIVVKTVRLLMYLWSFNVFGYCSRYNHSSFKTVCCLAYWFCALFCAPLSSIISNHYDDRLGVHSTLRCPTYFNLRYPNYPFVLVAVDYICAVPCMWQALSWSLKAGLLMILQCKQFKNKFLKIAQKSLLASVPCHMLNVASVYTF